MNGNRVLEDTFREILQVVKPVNNDRAVRFRIIEELQAVVRTVETLRGATAEPFGSFVSNLFTRSGDLDISVELANGSLISSSGKKEKQKLLIVLMRAMRQRGGWDKFNYIPRARVPILKVQSKIQNISCDISIDNLRAQIKSKFLLWISEIDARFRDMVLLVKEWAKAHNINDPKSGTFNSFSLSLLVVFHFQTCVPAIFPPLQDIYPGNIADDLKGLRANAERQIAETCAANISRFKSNRYRAVNNSSLSELFVSFLAKFSEISSMAKVRGICPFTGKFKGVTRWLPQTYPIFVEDPFEQPENSARTVTTRQLERISEEFKSSYNRLFSGNRNKNALLVALAQQQTNQQILRNPVNSAAGSAYQPNLPQWQRNEALQSQNGRNGGGPTRQHRQYSGPGLQVAPPRVVYSYSRAQPQSQSQTVQLQSPSNGSTSTATRPRVQMYHGQARSQPQSQTVRLQSPSNGSTSTATRPHVQTYRGQARSQLQSQTLRLQSLSIGSTSTATGPHVQTYYGQARP